MCDFFLPSISSSVSSLIPINPVNQNTAVFWGLIRGSHRFGDCHYFVGSIFNASKEIKILLSKIFKDPKIIGKLLIFIFFGNVSIRDIAVTPVSPIDSPSYFGR